MRGLGVLCATLVACSSGTKSEGAGSGSSAGSSAGPAEASAIPSGPVPVALPRAEPAHARAIQSAAAFVTVAKDGALALGKLAPGPTPYTGTPPRGTRTIESDLFAPPPAVAQAGSGSAGDDEPTAVEPDPAAAAPDAATVGQYKMKTNRADPQLARQQAIEAARKAGILGKLDKIDKIDVPLAQIDSSALAALVEGNRVTAFAEQIGAFDVLVLADAGARASAAVDVLAQLAKRRAGLAVEGKTAPMAVRFRFGPTPAYTGETSASLMLGPDDVLVDLRGASGKVPMTAGAIDKAALAKELGAVRGDDKPIGVLVGNTTTVQQLVDVIATLGAAGATTLSIRAQPTGGGGGMGTGIGTGGMRGYGAGPGSGGNPHMSSLPEPDVTGDLDKNIIRRIIRVHLNAITACYEKELLRKPKLAGTVTATFFIDPNGGVADSKASGVDPKVADCIARVIIKIEFPKPKGGGGVKVTYPFTFRSKPSPP